MSHPSAFVSLFEASSNSHTLLSKWLAMPIVAAVGVAALVWTAVLLLLWLNPWCSLEIKKQGADRFMATINAIVTGALGLRVGFWTTPQCTARMSWKSAPVLVFLGYLLVDLASMGICDIWQGWRAVDKSMIFHHIFILSCFTFGYVEDVGMWFASALLINELSTPFFTVFWYLQHTGQKASKAFMANGVVFVVAFFIFRILYIPFNFYQFLELGFCRQSHNTMYQWGWILMCLGYIAIYLLNGVWFVKLVRGALKSLQKKNDGIGNKTAADVAPLLNT